MEGKENQRAMRTLVRNRKIQVYINSEQLLKEIEAKSCSACVHFEKDCSKGEGCTGWRLIALATVNSKAREEMVAEEDSGISDGSYEPEHEWVSEYQEWQDFDPDC